MTKIYAQGNYIVIEANNERNIFPKRDVRFKVVDENGIYSLSSQELPIGDFNYSEVKKEDGSDYTTALEFETFLFENTGNFNSGADVSPNYIPLTGTEEGNPINGNMNVYSGFTMNSSDLDGNVSGYNISDGGVQIFHNKDFSEDVWVSNGLMVSYYYNDITNTYHGGTRVYGTSINNPNTNDSIGLYSDNDYSENLPENKLIYAQRQYVERPQTLINCLNNATPEQLSTIKSILGIV